MSRFNWKHILIHFVAFWFIGHGVMILSYLRYLELNEIIRTSPDPTNEVVARNIQAADPVNLLVTLKISFPLGILAALIIALVVCYRRKLFWLNSFIAFAILFILNRFRLSGWQYVKNIFWLPGSSFDGAAYYITNGLVLLLPGLLLLFWKWRFDNKENVVIPRSNFVVPRR